MQSFTVELKRFLLCIIYPILVCIAFFLFYGEYSILFYLQKLYHSISYSLIVTLLIAAPIAYSYAVLHLTKAKHIWLRIIIYYAIITSIMFAIILVQEGYIIYQSAPLITE